MSWYHDFVANLASNRINRTFLNSDEDHALEVLVQMFNNAQEIVRIFAGNLCDHVGNKDEYVIAISDFIERGGKVRILLNNYNEERIKTSKLFKRLAYYISDGHDIIIKHTNIKPYAIVNGERNFVHFTVSDETGYRIETDIENRTAECNFNNPESAKKIADFFDHILTQDFSINVDLNSLFNNGNK
jgi:hypothetical protein